MVRFIAALSLGLAGCGYGSYYPAPLSGDTGRETGEGTGDIPCPEATQRVIDLHITNARTDSLTVSKMEFDCVEQHVTAIPPNSDHTETSREGAVFVIRGSDGAIVDILQLPGDQSPYELMIQ